MALLSKKLTLNQITIMENQQLLDQVSLMNLCSEEELTLLFSYFSQEYNDQSITRKLLKKGYEEDRIIAMISEARRLYAVHKIKKKAKNEIIFGSILLVGGISASLINNGGMIFYGIMAFGMIQFFKGITNLKNN